MTIAFDDVELRAEEVVATVIHPRVEISLQVRVRDARGGDGRSYLSRDLGLDGLFVHTARPFASGDPVDLEFALPKLKAIRVRGEVLRAVHADDVVAPSEAGMTIRFSEMSKGDEELLRTFLRARGVF